MKKIAVIGVRGYPYVYGGYETLIKEISERLSTENFSITVYCHKNLFSHRPESIKNIQLVYISTLPYKIFATFSHSFLSTLHACIFKKFDFILYLNTANGPFGFITKLFNVKTGINTDGLEWDRPKWKGLGSKYFYFASYLSTKLFDLKISDSMEMQKIYSSKFSSKSVYIPYGGNIRASINPQLIDQFNIKKRAYYLIVGRLIPDNNSDFILDEYIRSKSSKKIVVVGDVPYKDAFASKIKKMKSNNIIFTGYIKNQDILAELYHNCFAYIHGHQYGGTNPTLLKALAYNSAIRGIDTPFTREVLNNDKYGFLFRKKQGELIKLFNLIESDEDSLTSYRLISKDKIKDIYNWDNVAMQYKENILKVIDE